MTDEKFNKIFPFKEPRKLQRKIIEKICESYDEGYTNVVIQAPTGIGKSVIAMSVSNYLLDNKSDIMNTSYILTSQKMLQEQYVNDFSIPTVKGRSNYPCTYEGGKTTAANGPCIKHKWNKSQRESTCPTCPYYVARDRTYSAEISVLNYSYFLNMGNDPLQEIQCKRKLLVLDECHSVEQILIQQASVIIDRLECNKFNLYDAVINFPSPTTNDNEKYDWLFNKVLPQLDDEYRSELSVFEDMRPSDTMFNFTFKKINYLKDLLIKIKNIETEYENNQPCAILQDGTKSIEFKPIFGKGLGKKYLNPFCDVTLSMSATVLSKEQYCRDMGYDKNDTVFIKLPSLFPVKNRKIYSMNVGSLAYKEKEKTKPKLLKAVRLLLEQHKNDCGIIHTGNYEIAEYLVENLKDNRLIMPRGKTRDTEIKLFIEGENNNKVLISPSLQEGIDLKDDLSRFTIICKCPFASLADDWVKKRMDLSPKWYAEQTVMNVVQSYGRSVRSETDYAVCYILDTVFDGFYKRNKSKFPSYFKDALILK